MSGNLLKETTMKSHATAAILAAVAVASFAGMALLAPIDQASAGPSAKADAVKATTTGTYQARCRPGSGGMCRK